MGLILDDNEDEDDKPDILPNEIKNKLDKLSCVPSENINTTKEDIDNSAIPKLSPDDNFIVARKTSKVWEGNTSFEEEGQKLSKAKYSGLLDLEVEINRVGAPVFARPVLSRSNDLDTHISNLRNGVAFLEDFRCSVQDYNADNTYTTLPLLVYYGGSAINTKFGEVGIRYIEQPYQAYKNALQPNRFDFEDFFEWLNWIKSNEPTYIFDRVEETILSALNADEAIYKDIRIEQGQLWLDKVYQEVGSSQPVEVSQLSAGEKNLFALMGDLTKRAIQLNPILFEIDFDENVGTFSNLLEYTQGVVLIDELDLHLHPKWQQQIMPTLQRLFPKIQFLVTTHSPFVLQSVPPVQRIRLNEGQPEYFDNKPVSDYEATLIDYFMMTDFFDPGTEKQLKEFRRLLGEVAQKRRKKNDSEFKKSIKELSEKGEIIKKVIAIELVQLNDKIK